MKLFHRKHNTTPEAPPEPGPTRAVRRLRHQLDEARDVHALTADPLLGAVNADRFRVSVTRSMWLFLAVGLGFTTTGVQAFLAGHLTMADPLWWGAWLVEPALAGILITLLRWESEMLSHGQQVNDGPVVKLKRLLLAATLVTNVWSAVRPSVGPISGGNVFLHVLIPLVVFLLAEVMPIIQQRCIAIRDAALQAAPAPAPLAAESGPVVEQAASVLPRATPPVTTPNMDTIAALRLPPHMTQTLTTRMTDLGRPLTAPEVAELLRLPGDFAVRVANQLAA